MAYVKLPVCAVNYALGYQTVEKARANCDAHYDAWALRHGTMEQVLVPNLRGGASRGQYFAPNVRLGHHNDTRIPRDMVDLTVTVSTPIFATPAVAISPSWYAQNPQRLGVGVYSIDVVGLTTFWAEATPKAASASTNYFAMTRSVFGGGTSPSRIVVNCYDISGGSFGAVDINLSLAVFGTP